MATLEVYMYEKPPEGVLVEVIDEIVEVFFVGLWSKPLSSNPFYLVSFLS